LIVYSNSSGPLGSEPNVNDEYPLDARRAACHDRPLNVVAEPSPEDPRRPPVVLVRVDRPRVARHRRAVAGAHGVEIPFGHVLLDRQRSPRAARQVVERYGVARHRPGELVPHSSIWALRGGVKHAEHLTARTRRLEQLRDGSRREAAASVLGQRDDAPDPAHLELAAAPPLSEVPRAGRGDDAIALEHAPHLLHRQPRCAFGQRARPHIEGDPHQPDDLVAVLVARRDHVRRRH
jgi:hypothetical protein